MSRRSDADERLARFYRRVWEHDVAPLLRGPRRRQRAHAAHVGGKLAGSAGLLADKLFGFRGRPFARFMTVLGSSLGAMLPDVWDWRWLRSADTRQQRVVAEQVRRRAAELPEADALALFGLTPSAARDELKRAWRDVSQRYHPDKAADERQRKEFHLRFLTYRAAYDRLVQAYEQGRLPIDDRHKTQHRPHSEKADRSMTS